MAKRVTMQPDNYNFAGAMPVRRIGGGRQGASSTNNTKMKDTKI